MNVLDLVTQTAQWAGQNMVDFVLPFLVVLSLLVFIHEWGHYIVARLCKVRVDEFSIGFGKELFGFTDKAGTRWKFCLVPLGGYVKMFGDVDPASAQHSDKVEIETHDENGEDVKRVMTEDERKVAFFNKSVGQRSAIVFAGPLINFLFAIIVLTAVFATHGRSVTPPVAASLLESGAAYEAGLRPHDEIVEINGKKIERFQDIQRQVTISLDRGLDITVLRNAQRITFENVAPKKVQLEDRFGFSHSRGLLGILAVGSTLDMQRVTAIEGRDVSTLSDAQKRDIFSQALDRTITITLDRSSAEETKTQDLVVLMRAEDNRAFINGEEQSPVLFAGETTKIQVYSWASAFWMSLVETKEITFGTLDALGQMITGTRSATELGGLIRIGAIAGDAASAGIVAFLIFAAMLSINLGLLNLFPIPVLDGGHLVFYAIEAVKGSPVSEKVQGYAFGAGMAVILALMLFANLNDLWQLFT
jgi:regulator of sigma E protease